jgi:DNA-binding PadR family transcriptional regulator
MYGLELMKIFKARGKEKLSPGLLYPTLNRLEEMELLKSREEKAEGSGATRRIYQTTEKGIEAIYQGLGPLPEFIDYLLWAESAELKKSIYKICDFKEGQIIVDFSKNLEDIIATEIGEYVGKTGRVYLEVKDPSYMDIVKNHIKDHNLENIIIPQSGDILDELSPGSADIATNIMSLHEEPDPQAIINTMRDVIKKDGRVVVADLHKIDHIIMNLIKRLAPQHDGFQQEELSQLFDKAGLETERMREEKGVIIIVGKKS